MFDRITAIFTFIIHVAEQINKNGNNKYRHLEKMDIIYRLYHTMFRQNQTQQKVSSEKCKRAWSRLNKK